MKIQQYKITLYLPDDQAQPAVAAPKDTASPPKALSIREAAHLYTCKIKDLSGKTRRGQNWLRPALVEAAWAASHTKTYFGSQFHRLRTRRGDKRAAVAVAHSILIGVYYLLDKPEAVYTDLGADYFTKRNAEQEQRRAIWKLEALGYTVNLTSAPTALAAPG